MASILPPFSSNLTCNEKGTATKEEDHDWPLRLTHPFGGFRRMTDANKTRCFKGLFVAVLFSLQNYLFGAKAF
ncbi:MAG: hypothetical protein ACREOO_15795 [bacterium]